MKTRGLSRFILSTLAACALVSGKSQAQSVLYTFDQIESEWQKVYPDNSPILKSVFTKYIDNGALFAEDGSASTPASPGSIFGSLPGKPETKLRFPIKNFDAPSLETFLSGQARIQLLKNTLKFYIGAREDTYREINETTDPGAIEQLYQSRKQAIDSMKKVVDLELYVTQMASYALSSSLTQRCHFWRQAQNLALDLQFHSGNEPAFALGGRVFADYFRQVKAFHVGSNGFSRIPPEICSLSVVNSRGDTLKSMQTAIDQAISVQMQAAVDSFQTIMSKRQQDLGMLMSQSEIRIPARGLYALEKGFKDTFDLLNLVQGDLLGLYKGDSSLMGQLKKQIDQMNTSEAEKSAQQHLNTFVLLYGKLLNKLASMPDTQGLQPASRVKLEVCRVLASIPEDKSSAGEIAEFQRSYNSCLEALVAEYKAARQGGKDDPVTLAFAESLAILVRNHTPVLPN